MAKKSGRGRLDRGLTPRKQDYSNERDGQRGDNVPPDDMTLNTSLCEVALIRARYKGGPLITMATPAFDETDPANRLKPGRDSAAPRGQSSWIIRVPVAKYIGVDRHCTFVLAEPRDKQALQTDPWTIISRAAMAAFKSSKFGDGRKWDSEWNKLCQGSDGQGAAISRPQAVWMYQGGVFQNHDRKYMEEAGRKVAFGIAEEDPLVVCQINETAGDGLLKLLDTKRKDYEGGLETPAELYAAFRYHAIGKINYAERTITGGRVLIVFNPDHTKITKCTSWDGRPPKKGSPWSYEAALAPFFQFGDQQLKADLSGDYFDEVFNKGQFWLPDKDTNQPGLIRFMSNEEKMVVIAEAFASVSKLILFATAEHPELITDDVKGIFGRRKSSVGPARPDDEDEDEGEEAEEAPAEEATDEEDEDKGKKAKGKKATLPKGKKDTALTQKGLYDDPTKDGDGDGEDEEEEEEEVAPAEDDEDEDEGDEEEEAAEEEGAEADEEEEEEEAPKKGKSAKQKKDDKVFAGANKQKDEEALAALEKSQKAAQAAAARSAKRTTKAEAPPPVNGEAAPKAGKKPAPKAGKKPAK